MNQCVPSWDLDGNSALPGLDYEVAELTWKNGQLAMHGLGPPRVPPTKYTAWDKPRAGAGTLESIVNQATRLPYPKSASDGSGDDLVPWIDHRRSKANPADSASVTMTMDALVPCNNINRNDNPVPSSKVLESGTCVVGFSTRVGSCSGVAATLDGGVAGGNHAPRHVDFNSCDTNRSASESATCGLDSRQLTHDTCEKDQMGVAGFTSPSTDSPENTSSGKEYSKSTGEDHDSVCHSRRQRDKCDIDESKKRGSGKSSVLTKRSRAAAIHNQSERKRRDRINQRMKTLQKLVPSSSKTDKASMLDEVIEYVKQLQAQVQVMRMNMPHMNMMPLAAMQQHQHFQMPMMNPMGMGMGMGIMDLNAMGRPGTGMLPPPTAGIPLAPASFMPVGASWDNPGERLQGPPSVMTDPLSMFMAWQSQLMTIDAYNRLAALYQQFQQPPGSSSKN